MSKATRQSNAVPDHAPAEKYVLVREADSIEMSPTIPGGVAITIRGRNERGEAVIVEAQMG